ncbi:hypothetical protein [Nocardioides flavescens]|uniref:Uncharacterized protein n=1 Tax=Nocardioides flavescens TaxID=2691959 RepID=A0A6L7EM81_9ACTN|nr:hypothetical protein [Nocardioides flavescens]MXG88437.1 hypothetical protein [Nocardioides flavescens]
MDDPSSVGLDQVVVVARELVDSLAVEGDSHLQIWAANEELVELLLPAEGLDDVVDQRVPVGIAAVVAAGEVAFD